MFIPALQKIPSFHLISSCGNFVERESFRIISGESPKTMQKLYLSTKFPHQEIRSKYHIFLFIRDFSSQSHFSQMPYNKLELLGRGYLPKETFVNKELDIFIGWWGRRSNSCYVLFNTDIVLKMLICLLISWFLPLTNVSNVFRLASKTLI